MLSHCLLNCIVSDVKSADDLTERTLTWKNSLSVTVFWILSFCVAFDSLAQFYLRMGLFELILPGICWGSWMCRPVIVKVSSHLFLEFFSCSFLALSSSSPTVNIWCSRGALWFLEAPPPPPPSSSCSSFYLCSCLCSPPPWSLIVVFSSSYLLLSPVVNLAFSRFIFLTA